MKKSRTGREIGVVYLCCFSHNPVGHARHYTGFAVDLEHRIAEHRAGRGARLLQVLRERGGTFFVTRVWEGVLPAFEKRLKKNKNGAARRCPACKGTARLARLLEADDDTVGRSVRTPAVREAKGRAAHRVAS